ncbi:acyl-CoA thioesterase [Ectobacillus sp. sgz5001026]|uniref:acyl-CoA thioesterase n=1 Tax=Ectobacillus sp. sgz5001026 TaxID=3242473 RepID=UPI0036D27F32
MEPKYCKESKSIKTSRVFPNDTNNNDTLFGGRLMYMIDDVASIAAARHSRNFTVTASTDSVDFLNPITKADAVCLEAYVTWTGRTSMEVFVKITAENLLTGEHKIAATSFLTFVAIGKDGKPTEVATVIPETNEEKFLHKTAIERATRRIENRQHSKSLAEFINSNGNITVPNIF